MKLAIADSYFIQASISYQKWEGLQSLNPRPCGLRMRLNETQKLYYTTGASEEEELHNMPQSTHYIYLNGCPS